ncbi:MAG: SPASM domain-containing protein [Nitrospirae bacterium]|nr:SPASM domain-containing protein [Nitrospirota bacterium]
MTTPARPFHRRIPYPFDTLLADWPRSAAGWGYLRTLARRIVHLLRTAWAIAFLPARPPLPIRLQVEPTNKCNLSCIMCAREFRDVFSKDFPNDRFATLLAEARPSYLTLNGDGEPLLDRGLADKIKAAKALGCIVVMPSNMTITSEVRGRKLIEAGLDVLSFSLDGATKDSFEAVRKGSRFEKVMGHVRLFRDLCARHAATAPELRVLFVVQKGNLMDFDHALALQRELGLTIQLIPVKYLEQPEVARTCRAEESLLADMEARLDGRARDGTPPDALDFYERWRRAAREACTPPGPSRVCYKPWTTAYVDARGDVYPCCFSVDREGSLKMGNVFDRSFGEIWRGERYADFRRGMLARKSALPVCSTCTVSDDDLHARVRRLLMWLPAPLHWAWKNR